MRTTRWPDNVPGAVRSAAAAPWLAEAWADFLGRLPWGYFVTLTFDPRKVFPVSKALADREVRGWIRDVERMTRRQVGWLYAIERGRSGLWHGHALVTDDVPNVVVNAANVVWRERNGRFDLRPVGHKRGAVVYTTKDGLRGGEVVPGPGLGSYRDRLSDDVVIALSQPD